MRTALPIPAFARGRSNPPPYGVPKHFIEGMAGRGMTTSEVRLAWTQKLCPDAKIALVTTIPPAPA